MKINKIWLAILLLITTSFSGYAFDLSVKMIIEETGEVYLESTPLISTSDGRRVIAQPVELTEDGIYIFKDIPDENILIIYELGGKYFARRVKKDSDLMTIKISQSSLPKKLSEVEVEADNRFFNEDKQVYIPSNREKKAASTGSRLLFNMAIPTLMVSLGDNSITTSTGEGVETFINYLPADAQAVANIRPSDVARVEILDFPKDPRFRNAQHVVNFILVKYEYGGYAKFSANQAFLFENGQYNAFSRVSYKKMIYEAGMGGSYGRQENTFRDVSSVYSFPSGDVTYNKTPLHSLQKYNNVNGFFKAIYQSPKVTASNIIGVSRDKTPDAHSSFRETFSSPEYISGDAYSHGSSRNISVSWNGSYYISLPHNFMFVAEPMASYAYYRNNNDYSSATTSIIDDTEDKAWNATLYAALQKQLGRHNVSLGIHTGLQSNDMTYLGSMPSKVNSDTYHLNIMATGTLSFGKFNLWMTASARFWRYVFNSKGTNETQPHACINLNYNINNRNQLSLYSEIGYVFNEPNLKAPNMQISDQINGIEGNPGLKSAIMSATNLKYTLFATNKLSLSANAGFTRWSRSGVWEYNPMTLDNREYMIKRFINRGFQNVFTYGLSPSLRLLNNSLNFNGWVGAVSTCQHGPMYYNRTYPSFNISANYFFSNFYISAQYISERTSIMQHGKTRHGSSLYIAAGWGNGNWNIDAIANNPFSKSSVMYREWASFPNYSTQSVAYAPSLRKFNFTVTVTYSFSFGKKIQHGNEASTPKGVGTNILK